MFFGVFSKSSLLVIIWRNLQALFCGAGNVAQLDAHPTGDQEVVGSSPSGSATLFYGDLIIKYFLQSFPPSLPKGSCQFLVKECAQYWLTA